MDPERVRSYLQVACAGLGFDIGEVWWTSDQNGSSTVAAIEEKNKSLALTGGSNQPRFVQLYTSKSFEEKRSMLVNPDEEDNNENALTLQGGATPSNKNSENLSKHVLSPLLVDAISKTAQVVWANTKKQEGLTGRSDVRLQTAVGMPVAMDNNGNMCIVVMFSPNNIQSTDDALEYLQSITQSATSTSIPTLHPVFDPKMGALAAIPHHEKSNQVIPLLASSLNDGVETRFVSLEVGTTNEVSDPSEAPEIHTQHELAAAPKDCFGIPMLPSFAELGGTGDDRAVAANIDMSDAFDEASYGVWSTIMENNLNSDVGPLFEPRAPQEFDSLNELESPVPADAQNDNIFSAPSRTTKKVPMSKQRKDRLEEFASAFLNVSVFDVADVWIPLDGQLDYLSHVLSVSSTRTSESLNKFMKFSENILIKYWSGAVGRAFSSGNPVWSANPEVFIDSGRVEVFSKVHFQTALAVPIFSSKTASPACVLCCYSYVRTGSVPFVLRFVQQALRLLWDGLDNVEPHESVGKELWRDVAPADLGEMAADVEMQQHFMVKKRPRAAISSTAPGDESESSLAEQLGALGAPSGVPATNSIYTGQQGYSPTMESSEEPPSPDLGPSLPPVHAQTLHNVQSHFQNAVKAVVDAVPFPMHKHVPTNVQGSKRAHVMGASGPEPSLGATNYPFQPAPSASPTFGYARTQFAEQPTPAPLPMPRPLPLPNQLATHAPPIANAQGPTIEILQAPPPPQQQQQQQQQSSATFYDSNQGHPLQQQPEIQQASQLFHRDQNQPMHQPISQFDQNQQYGVPLDQSHGAQAPMYQTGASASVHFDHTYSSNVQTTMPPQMIQQPAASTMAAPTAAPMNAGEMSYPQPHTIQNSAMDQGPLPDGSFATSPNQIMSAPIAYCIPTNGNSIASELATSGKPCRIQGCNEPATSRRPYCVRHSGSRLCEHEGCSKCAQGSTRFCIAHGGGRRCTFPGCDKGARDKFFCAAHGGGKRCKFEGCTKSAVGGSQLCTAHGGGRRCCVEGCDKSAQSSTKFCVKHGGGKKCLHPGCEKVARGRTQYCAAHGGGIRCKLAGCNRVAIGKLQLCRAHGGGARPRPKAASANHQEDFPPTADVSFQGLGASV